MKQNDFIMSLKEIALESAGIEMPTVDKYAGSNCAEEFMALDDFDNAVIATESFAGAALEAVFEPQLIALESAGLNGLEEVQKFDGELSTEAVTNMVKRGAYNIKIQAKKAISKIWSLIMSVVTMLTGSEGRLKSYGKLCKKYREKLAKMSPKVKGEEKEISIRKWDGLAKQIKDFKSMADVDLIKTIKTAVQAVDVKNISELANKIVSVASEFGKLTQKVSGTTTPNSAKFTTGTAAEIEAMEKSLDDAIKDSTFKEDLDEAIKKLKEVETDEYAITTAQSNMLNWLGAVETECNKDVKFKKEIDSLNKVWKKKFSEFEIKENNDDNNKAAALMRLMSKAGTFIGMIRTALSKNYQASASNIQGLLADAAKVLAKGTNIGA